MASFSFPQLLNAVSQNAAAFRSRTKLQPAGGPGSKVFPSTFAGSTYALENRRIPNPAEPGKPEVVPCVVLDSVQSQANRMEEALQAAVDAGTLELPVIEIDFSKADLVDKVENITSLTVPHRIADAILRDSEFKGEKFRSSEVGKSIDSASNRNATPLYKLCPTSLLFGMWDSTGPKGGLGVKFERAIVSEIVGIGCEVVEKNHGIRRDPLQISKSVLVKGTPTDWKVADAKNNKGAVRPSELNHGSVPFDNNNGGVTIDHAEQTITLSLIALRRLKFPINGKMSPDMDVAGQAVLAALGLCAATLASENGFDLRSRCLLWPNETMQWELLAKPGQEPEKFTLDSKSAIKLLQDAIAHAEKSGLKWQTQPIKLTPSKELEELVRKSQEALAKGESAEGED